MGYMESAVVVYLRAIYYPEGFAFPLKELAPAIGITELLREFSTLVMLLAVSLIAARKFILRFAFFIYAFALWDIFYYVFLYLLIRWPSSLLEWDILFLIPVAWTGPVIAPIINSLTMILLALFIIRGETSTGNARITTSEWILLLLGSIVMIITYTMDYAGYLLGYHTESGHALPVSGYIPHSFNWWLFASGELLFITALVPHFTYFCKPLHTIC